MLVLAMEFSRDARADAPRKRNRDSRAHPSHGQEDPSEDGRTYDQTCSRIAD